MHCYFKEPQGRLKSVLELIPRGIEHPRTVADISKLTGINTRNVYDIIRVLIMQYHIPIGGLRSDGRHGVFIATTETERAAAITPLANNAREIQRRVDALREMELQK